jgi:hypothetical protein
VTSADDDSELILTIVLPSVGAGLVCIALSALAVFLLLRRSSRRNNLSTINGIHLSPIVIHLLNDVTGITKEFY